LAEFLGTPHFEELSLVELPPFLDQALRPVRQISLDHFQRLDGEDAVEFAVNRVEVSDAMLLELHLDDNTIEPRDDRHPAPLTQQSRCRCAPERPG
jgi:hypothetical protein